MSELITPNNVQGRVRGWQGDSPATLWKSNLVMYDWATIIAKLVAGDLDYRVNGLYIEYENTGGSATIPSFGRGDGISYYQGLGAGRDFIRVPIAGVTTTSSNETNFPDGNVMTFFGQTQGSAGVLGETFSNAVNSKVCGAALVAMPDQADYTQDLVFSRFYFDVADQIAKLASSQVGIEWAVTLQ